MAAVDDDHDSVDNLKMKDDSVDIKSNSNSVDDEKFNNSVIDDAKLNSVSVDNVKLNIDPVEDVKFNNDSIEDVKFNNDSIGDVKFNNDSIEDVKFNNDSIGDEKFNNDSIGDVKFNNYSITDVKSNYNIKNVKSNCDSIDAKSNNKSKKGVKSNTFPKDVVKSKKDSKEDVKSNNKSKKGVKSNTYPKEDVVKSKKDSKEDVKSNNDLINYIKINNDSVYDTKSNDSIDVKSSNSLGDVKFNSGDNVKFSDDSEDDIKCYSNKSTETVVPLNFNNCDSGSDIDAADVNEPPLIMQSSNLPTEDGLDNRHGGGGNETSNDSCEDDICDNNKTNQESDEDSTVGPPRKKLKQDVDNSHEMKSVYYSENSQDDKSPVADLGYPFVKENKAESCNGGGNEKVSGVQISSNSGMMEFDILDEFESNDNDNDNYNDDDNDDDNTSDSSIDLDELDAMLDEGLQNGKRKADEQEHEEKQKVILKVRGRDHFDVLPEGWIEVTHNSGMPIYLHKASRVCSVSKPYFLGPGSTRKHEIPISAIPCLHYSKELEKEKNSKEETNAEEWAVNGSLPSAKLESVKDNKQSGSLDYMAVREYCEKRFEFQTITVKRFKTWSGRRMHQKQLRQKQRPTLPDNTKLITCPLPPASDKSASTWNNTKREFIMNPCGKSPVCILHEYVQHTLRVQPKYKFKELENASTPYGAVVLINDMEYGYGYGSSKKQAKSEAAKAALDVLIPKMKMFASDGQGEDQQDLEFFDQVRVEDPRVSELSVKAGQPYPYQILLECLKRNYGMGDTEIGLKMHNLKHQKNEFLMTVGKHSVSVICKNKRDGKHRASQAILQLLHPHINSWGSLLRMYGKGSCKTLKEKKEEEQRITELQSQACANKPNLSILNKLKEEMLKYREKMKMKKPIGKLIPEQMELSTSDSNLKNVEL